ncbi:hypothetical protein EGR_01424 [Echinococcus granulosus]|uniref:Uncharacterized protein n=1 Tax=Echinococcus granulosus TaxID=6210 RepID=W6USY8_ECHGR|nr:hypothetical protein EGR_01424 [Echinococcus granulosus]EUB63801.1 hypothetical protein EGR_01424 [Echinococcus granulosus]
MYHNLADHRQHTSHVGGTAAYLDGIFYNRYRLKANYHKKEIFLNRMNTYGLHLLQDECVFAMGSVNCLRFPIGKHENLQKRKYNSMRVMFNSRDFIGSSPLGRIVKSCIYAKTCIKRLQLISHPSLVQNIKLQKYKSLPSKKDQKAIYAIYSTKHTKFNKYQLWLSSLNNNIKHKSRWLSALMNGIAEAIPRQKGKLWHQIFQSLGTMNIRDNRFKSALKFFTRPSATEKTTTKWVRLIRHYFTNTTTNLSMSLVLPQNGNAFDTQKSRIHVNCCKGDQKRIQTVLEKPKGVFATIVYAILFVTKVTTLNLSAQKCKRSIEKDLDFDTKIPSITKVYSLLIYVMVTSAGLKALTQRAISNLAAIPTVVASINQSLMRNTTHLCLVSSISLPSRSRTSVTVMNGSLPRHEGCYFIIFLTFNEQFSILAKTNYFASIKTLRYSYDKLKKLLTYDFQNTADINYSRGIFIWTRNSLIVFIFSNHVKNLDANCIKIHTIRFCTTYVKATSFPKNQNDQEHLKGEQTYEYFFNFICWLEIVGAKGLYMEFYVCCLNKA